MRLVEKDVDRGTQIFFIVSFRFSTLADNLGTLAYKLNDNCGYTIDTVSFIVLFKLKNLLASLSNLNLD